MSLADHPKIQPQQPRTPCPTSTIGTIDIDVDNRARSDRANSPIYRNLIAKKRKWSQMVSAARVTTKTPSARHVWDDNALELQGVSRLPESRFR